MPEEFIKELKEKLSIAICIETPQFAYSEGMVDIKVTLLFDDEEISSDYETLDTSD